MKLALLALAACTAEPSHAAPLAPDACRAATTDLATWLRALATEGQTQITSPTLAAVDGAPAPVVVPDTAHWITIAGDVTIDGTFATPASAPGVIAELTRTRVPVVATTKHGALVDHRPGVHVIAVDAHARWDAVVAVVDAIRDTGAREVTFVVRARGSVMAKPAPSSIDGEFPRPSAPLPERVFARCPEVLAWLPTLSTATDRTNRIASELPPLVARCDCNLELPALRRLMWAWWGRDLANAPTVVFTLALDPAGAPLAAHGTDEWATVVERVATRRGTATQLVVQ